jgi:hypothetical protein
VAIRNGLQKKTTEKIVEHGFGLVRDITELAEGRVRDSLKLPKAAFEDNEEVVPTESAPSEPEEVDVPPTSVLSLENIEEPSTGSKGSKPAKSRESRI